MFFQSLNHHTPCLANGCFHMHDPRKASIYDPLTPLIRGTEAGKTNYTDSRLKIVLARNSIALAVLFQYSRYYIVVAFISNKFTPDLKFNIYRQKVSQGELVNVHIVMAVVNFFYRLETLKDLKPVCIFLLKKKTSSHFIILTCMIGRPCQENQAEDQIRHYCIDILTNSQPDLIIQWNPDITINIFQPDQCQLQ